jgi:hypothetical protein
MIKSLEIGLEGVFSQTFTVKVDEVFRAMSVPISAWGQHWMLWKKQMYKKRTTWH